MGRESSRKIDWNKLVKVRWSCPCAFNWEPRHEGVLGEWNYSSIQSWHT